MSHTIHDFLAAYRAISQWYGLDWGNGKTFTGLKITEKVAGKNAAPSSPPPA
ncbi:MAG: hypothetical protein NTW21_14095 [Verrucomicrobia bacterium]|nr:hypothetical protein [Verrucomicrobiota bacterium]